MELIVRKTTPGGIDPMADVVLKPRSHNAGAEMGLRDGLITPARVLNTFANGRRGQGG